MKLSYLQRCEWTQSVILSGANQKEKNHILTHIHETQKNGMDKPICRKGIETQMQRMNVWAWRWDADGMSQEIGIDVCALPCIKQLASGNLLYSTGSSARCSAVVQMGRRRPKREVMVVQLLSRVQPCDPMHCSLPDSSVNGILQSRILGWVAISSVCLCVCVCVCVCVCKQS